MPTTLILASASPSRRQLLSNAGLAFEIEPSGVDEDEVTRSLLGEQVNLVRSDVFGTEQLRGAVEVQSETRDGVERVEAR